MFAFRQIHKVLGMEMLPQPKYTPKYNYRFNRKRRRDNSSGEGNDSEGKSRNSALPVEIVLNKMFRP